mmetsp:Transcript_49110/g.59508  ORF Transcript_49110/g.59508 Transcript_49110/m.59508 type:complete len:162 (-) Transcript_49110:147-632(-)|eukprot:CAMPEP_0172494932 /NCGR_PEP_ID=MMETSP1066-20121228/58986_1 /TAXON_ID=671091 /ORGANISM="Coscinodiscus wailesii, Strain CCMP2513" /LENGTH=161 /DNA_ID=CAMNT_0013266267 /DNA_START=40 /DNA_END=525 /DNA_ORIENTATION=+
MRWALQLFLTKAVLSMGEILSGNIRGVPCTSATVVGNECTRGYPHYDREGGECLNDGEDDEAYCSYDFGDKACAYCNTHRFRGIINWDYCSSATVVGDFCPDRGWSDVDPEGAVCANGGKDNEAYCSYDLGDNVCAYCNDGEDITRGEANLGDVAGANDKF